MQLGSVRHLAAAYAPSPRSSQEVLQGLEVRRILSHKVLRPPVLLQSPKKPRIGDVHAAVFLAAVLECVLADAVPPA